jgi:diamine N-acetyltransferase
MIGFTELAYEPDSTDTYWLFHFFIDAAYQGQGYGKQALRRFLGFIRQQHTHCCSIRLTVHPENVRAQRLYSGAGFQPTGDTMEGEPIYQLIVR